MNYSFVLIGCGRIAERHAQQIKRLGKLVAVCDIDTQKAIDFAEKHSTKAYFSIEELLHNEKQSMMNYLKNLNYQKLKPLLEHPDFFGKGLGLVLSYTKVQ